MAVNKNFVVKNGLQVSDNLIFADALEGRVGVGTTSPKDHLLHVFGGIGVTDAYVAGITTIADNLQVGLGGTVLNVIATPGIENFIGIGNSTPEYLLDVRAPVSTGQTSLYVYGDARITGDLHVGDDLTFDELNARHADISGQTSINLLSVSGISTFTGIGSFGSDLYVDGNLNVVGDVVYDEVNGRNLSISGITTTQNLDVPNHTLLNTLSVSGVSTLTNQVEIRSDDTAPGRIDFYCEVNNLHRVRLKSPPHAEFSGNPDVILPRVSGDLLVGNTTSPISQDLNTTGIITASYFYGDGTHLENVIRGVGIQTGGGPISYGATILNFAGPGVSTSYFDSNVGVGTIFFRGGGGGANVEVSNSAPEDPNLGDLWFHSEIGRTFIYYDETELGVGTDAFWVDAAPASSSGNNNVSGSTSITVSENAPNTSPLQEGALWWNSSAGDASLYVLYQDPDTGLKQWIEASPATTTVDMSNYSTTAEVNTIVDNKIANAALSLASLPTLP
mgnify:FL=1|tara:strand:- start:832 stop:2343 length:1512 start_codon:yes stop_codon:yes gene_type:complete